MKIRIRSWTCVVLGLVGCWAADNARAAVILGNAGNANFSSDSSPRNDYYLDINGDGINDLRFMGGIGNGTLNGDGISVLSLGNAQVQEYPFPSPDIGGYAWPLDSGATVGDTPVSSYAQWLADPNSALFRYSDSTGSVGLWPGNGQGSFDPFSAYLAVRLQESDGWHYGWVEVAAYGIGNSGFVRSYGFETEPGVFTVAGAPEPARLLLTALGLVALFLRRRKCRHEAA